MRPSCRHSGAGRNPAIKNSLRNRQQQNVVPHSREIVNHLDSGLRRNDVVFDNEFSGMKV